MSYEVYIDVEHHDKHWYGDDPATESYCTKMSDSNGDGYPEDHAPLIQVAASLRIMADKIDPRYVCLDCGQTRGNHDRRGGLYYCKDGRTDGCVKHDRWQEPSELSCKCQITNDICPCHGKRAKK